MKKIYVLFVFTLSFYGTAAVACDICGCGTGNYYIGILPEFKSRFMGLRYQYKRMHTGLSPDGTSSYLTNQETYQTLEFWGAVNIGKRFRVLGFLPLNYNQKTNQGVTYDQKGLGDIAAVGYYNLLQERKTTAGHRLLVQSLWLGAGVKAPTGHYNADEKNNGAYNQNNFQLGTGSWDFTANAMYDVRLNDAGLNVNLSYKMNTENADQYKYGNKFYANLLGYYKFRVSQTVTIAPNAGILYEQSAKDQHNGNTVQESGGYSLVGTLGAELSLKKFGLGFNVQSPLAQHLGGGTVYANNRCMMHVSLPL